MKNSIKKLLSILLASAICLSFAGCGEKKEKETANDDFFADSETVIEKEETTNDKSSDSNNTSISKENIVSGKSWKEVLKGMPKNLKGTTVRVYNWNPKSEYTGAPTVISQFEKQTGIKVEWQTVNFDVYTTRLAALVASGDSPDVVRTRTPDPQWMQSFQPLSTTGYDFSDDAWDKTLMKDYSVNGVCYATSLKNTHLGSVAMIHYNKSLIEKYDMENPYTLWKNGKWTTDKFISMCKDYIKKSGSKVACGGMLYDTWSQLYGIAGPVGFDGTKYYSNLRNSKFLTVTQEVADLFNTDHLFFEGVSEIFDAGDALFFAGASVYARKKNSYFGTLKSAGSFYAVPMPSVPGQSKYYQARDEYEAYAIANGAKNAKAVPYFLRYFLDGSNYDLNGFFCNKQNLEVYNWCMNQENTIWTTYYRRGDSDNFGSKENGIYSISGNQVKSFVDSNAAVINQRVSTFNDQIKKLKK